VVLAFHKPYGVLCQFTPKEPGQRTLANFGFPPGVYPVGRLDLDSEGLLLLSDEPGFNNRLLDPRTGHPRTYLAQVDGQPSADALERLRRGGLDLQGHRTRPCRAWMPDPQPELPPRDPPIRVRKAIPAPWIALTLTEGKNRQVRRMTAAVGHPTLRLVRVAIGGLDGTRLAAGAWERLGPADVARVWQR
jgi:23S rRNA pseudouridine2457 synthase